MNVPLSPSLSPSLSVYLSLSPSLSLTPLLPVSLKSINISSGEDFEKYSQHILSTLLLHGTVAGLCGIFLKN